MADTQDRASALRALQAAAEAAEAEADAASAPDEESALRDRIEAAMKRRDEAIRAATIKAWLTEERAKANGAYAVDALDADASTPGAGYYVLRSPGQREWREFRGAVQAANGSDDKTERAYRNLAGKCILRPTEAEGLTGDEFRARCDRFVGLSASIGDEAGRLGGVAADQRKSGRR